jgi:EAL domain-containing protein (putative c-di-GMP-specific phosphodiesterase class I)
VRTALLPDCRPLLADPGDLTLVFQPIVDLTDATVSGYRALARFPGTAGPDVWFAAAEDAGVRAELEALAVHKALTAVDALPAHMFLMIGVSASLLCSVPVQRALATRSGLEHVVVELSERIPGEDLPALREACDELRRRGARIALDDTGSGSSGLRQLTALRPHVVTLDAALVADADPVDAGLAGMLGEVAGRIDARLLADGLETPAELAACARLGVALGQGWLLGRPAPTFQPLSPAAITLVQAQAVRAGLTDTVAALLRPVRQVTADDAESFPPAVVLGECGEPVGLLLGDPRTGESYSAPVSLTVAPSADIAETLQRALSRPPAQRFDPVLCTDAAGAVLGVLRVEDLAAARPKR